MPPAPTVPSRFDTKPGGRGSPLGWFRALGSGPGAWGLNPPGSFAKLALGSVPRGLPVRAEALAVRHAADPEPGSRLPPAASRSRSSVSPPAGRLRPKSQPCLTGLGLAPLARRFAAPGPKPGPARNDKRSRSPLAPVAMRRPEGPAFRRTGLQPELRSRLLVSNPKARDLGRFTKPATSASAKGQACSFRMAAASSAARAFARLPFCLVGQEAAFAPAVAGKALDRCRSIVSATARKLSRFPIRTKGLVAVDNEDNGHK